MATKNYSLGKFMIPDLPAGKAGSVKVEVNFKIDENSILRVKSKTLFDGKTYELEIKPEDHFALTEEEVNQMIAQGQFLRNQISFGDDD